MYCISGMDLCAVLDILEHLIIIKVRQMYNQEITKTIAGKNFIRHIRARITWLASSQPLHLFQVTSENPDERVFVGNKLLIKALPNILFYVQDGHTVATFDLKSAVRISSDIFQGYLPAKSFTTCDQTTLANHDYNKSDKERLRHLNLKQLSELVPNYLGPHVTQESRENFRQIIHQVQNN